VVVVTGVIRVDIAYTVECLYCRHPWTSKISEISRGQDLDLDKHPKKPEISRGVLSLSHVHIQIFASKL